MRRPSTTITRVLLAAGAAIFIGCAPQGGEAPAVIETEEVGPAPDAELDLSSDRKAKPRQAAGGQLPGSFPDGLPVYQPSSISDLGAVESGQFVHFVSSDDSERVRAWYRDALSRGGWAVELGPGGEMVATRGGRRATIAIEDGGPVTLILVDY